MAHHGYPGYYHTDPYEGRGYNTTPHHPSSREFRDFGPPQPKEYHHRQYPREREDMVISQQPRMMGGGGPGQRPLPQREWNSGLFDCMSDAKTCFCVLCNPCYSCYLAEKFGESWLNVCCMGSVGTFLALRYKIRATEKIEGSLLEDFFVSAFCHSCVVCQLKRERDQILRMEGRLI